MYIWARMEGLQRLATPCLPLVRWRWQVWYLLLITTCSHVLKSMGDFQATGSSHHPLTAMLLESIAMQLLFALWCFCKNMPFYWLESVHLPRMCMTCISHVYHVAFAEVSGSGVVGTLPSLVAQIVRCNRDVRCNSIRTPKSLVMGQVLTCDAKSLSLLSNHRNGRRAPAQILRCWLAMRNIGMFFKIERREMPAIRTLTIVWLRCERPRCQIASDAGRAMRATKLPSALVPKQSVKMRCNSRNIL